MAVFDPGGGGGRAASGADTDAFALAVQADLQWPLTPEGLQQIAEAIRQVDYTLQRLKTMVKSASGNYLDDVTAQRLIGRYAGTDGQWQEIQLGSNLTLSSAGVLSSSAAAGGGTAELKIQRTTLTKSQIETADVYSVVTGVAGKVLVPFQAWWRCHATVPTGASWNANRAFSWRYSTQTAPAPMSAFTLTLNSGLVESHQEGFVASTTGTNTRSATLDRFVGEDLALSSTGDISNTDGNADVDLTLTVAYIEVDP